jgi:Tfp pilus assembly protein PilV
VTPQQILQWCRSVPRWVVGVVLATIIVLGFVSIWRRYQQAERRAAAESIQRQQAEAEVQRLRLDAATAARRDAKVQQATQRHDAKAATIRTEAERLDQVGDDADRAAAEFDRAFGGKP